MLCLDISGPNLLNLLFYNLLGVINQTENRTKPYLIKLVKNLVKDYIKSENVLILLACFMEGNICNFSAFGILCNLKAEYHCIGELLYGNPIYAV